MIYDDPGAQEDVDSHQVGGLAATGSAAPPLEHRKHPPAKFKANMGSTTLASNDRRYDCKAQQMRMPGNA